MQRAYLVDASVHVFRAYYSIPPDMTDSEGFPANAVYGFTGFLLTLLDQVADDAPVVVCFDESLETSFRNDIYPDYKANREPAPEELRRQFAHCRAIAEALGLPCYSHDRYEADDLIGAVAHVARPSHHLSIVSSDKDLAQLLGENDELWDFGKNRRLDGDAIFERFGVRPDQIADFLALTGDSVDNIPGVPGVGPKTAAILLGHFDTVDQLLDRLDEIAFLRMRGAKSLAAKLRQHRDLLTLCRQLTEIVLEIPDFFPELGRRPRCAQSLTELYDYLNFGNLIRRRSGLVG